MDLSGKKRWYRNRCHYALTGSHHFPVVGHQSVYDVPCSTIGCVIFFLLFVAFEPNSVLICEPSSVDFGVPPMPYSHEASLGSMGDPDPEP